MGLMLDTSVLVEYERRGEEADFSPWSGYGPTFISAVTLSEALVGVHRADTDERAQRRSVWIDRLLQRVRVLPFDSDTARTHASLFAQLMRDGRLIGAHDLLIGATAIQHDHHLLTSDFDEFARVPGLKLLQFSHPQS